MTDVARVVGLLLSAGIAVACQGESQLGRVEQAVIGGVPSQREGVMRIMAFGDDYPRGCSGTLVAPNLVLTARHFVSVFNDGQYRCNVEGEVDEAFQRVPSSAGDMGVLYSFDQIELYLGEVPDESAPAAVAEELVAPETDTICRNDLAFIVLDRDLDLPLTAIRLGRIVPGEEVTVVGYGSNGTSAVSRYERDLSILAVGESTYYPEGGLAMPRTFAVGQGPCPGDSGGPAISVDTGDILGVYSLVGGDCMSSQARNFFTHVGSFESIVRQAFAAAGHEEILDPPPATGGSASDGGGGEGPSDGGSGSDSGGGCTLSPAGGPGLGFFGVGSAAAVLLLLRRRASTRKRAQRASPRGDGLSASAAKTS
jgi:hypothetical protein